MKTSWSDELGDHWPSAILSDDKYYALNLTGLLANEGYSLTSVNWVLPTNVTSSDSYETSTHAYAKLATTTVGDYEINCEMSITSGAKSQVITQKMLLNVS